MKNINIITPPDKLFNDAVQVLLVYPTTDLKNAIQDKLVDHYGSDAADKIGSQGTSAIMMKYRTNQ